MNSFDQMTIEIFSVLVCRIKAVNKVVKLPVSGWIGQDTKITSRRNVLHQWWGWRSVVGQGGWWVTRTAGVKEDYWWGQVLSSCSELIKISSSHPRQLVTVSLACPSPFHLPWSTALCSPWVPTTAWALYSERPHPGALQNTGGLYGPLLCGPQNQVRMLWPGICTGTCWGLTLAVRLSHMQVLRSLRVPALAVFATPSYVLLSLFPSLTLTDPISPAFTHYDVLYMHTFYADTYNRVPSVRGLLVLWLNSMPRKKSSLEIFRCVTL